jgi:hypothetical protein
MSEQEEDDAAVRVMVRTMDAWFLLNPQLTRDAVVAWLESVEVPADPDTVLDAKEIG